jgi:hypothetical protein
MGLTSRKVGLDESVIKEEETAALLLGGADAVSDEAAPLVIIEPL